MCRSPEEHPPHGKRCEKRGSEASQKQRRDARNQKRRELYAARKTVSVTNPEEPTDEVSSHSYSSDEFYAALGKVNGLSYFEAENLEKLQNLRAEAGLEPLTPAQEEQVNGIVGSSVKEVQNFKASLNVHKSTFPKNLKETVLSEEERERLIQTNKAIFEDAYYHEDQIDQNLHQIISMYSAGAKDQTLFRDYGRNSRQDIRINAREYLIIGGAKNVDLENLRSLDPDYRLKLETAGVKYPLNWDEMGGSEKDWFEEQALRSLVKFGF